MNVLNTPQVPTSTVDSSATKTKGPTYHPLFSSPEADIVLRSLEGTLFRVHSYILRTTSGLFRTVFTLPQPPTQSKDSTIISIYEPSQLLCLLLPLLSGQPTTPPLTSLSLNTIIRLLFLAEKWDTPGPISYIRNIINASCSPFPSPLSPLSLFFPGSAISSSSSLPLLSFEEHMQATMRQGSNECSQVSPAGLFYTSPLQIYAISRHFEWREEAERAATCTLALSTYELEKGWKELQEGGGEGEGEEDTLTETEMIRMMVTRKDWELLVELRRKRCRMFKDLIDSQERFTAGNNPNYMCTRCGQDNLDNSPWYAMKHAMLVELEERPLGGTVIAAVGVSLPDVSVVGGSRVEPYPTCSSMRQREDGAVAAGDGPDAEKGATTAIRGPRKEDAIWPEVEACFKAKCPNEQCGAVNYDRTATIKQIRRCVEVLPWKIGQWSDVEGM